MAKQSLKKPKKSVKANQSGKPVLTSAEQIQVCLWIAWFKSDTEIIKLVRNHFSKAITYSTLKKTYRDGEKWEKFIAEEHSRYLKDLQSVPISNAKVRLERLEKIYHEAMTWRVSTMNQFGVVKKLELGAAAQSLRDAKIEMVGEDEEDWSGEEIELFQGNGGNGGKLVAHRFERFLN